MGFFGTSRLAAAGGRLDFHQAYQRFQSLSDEREERHERHVRVPAYGRHFRRTRVRLAQASSPGRRSSPSLGSPPGDPSALAAKPQLSWPAFWSAVARHRFGWPEMLASAFDSF